MTSNEHGTPPDADRVYAESVAAPVREAQALVAGNDAAVLWRLLAPTTLSVSWSNWGLRVSGPCFAPLNRLVMGRMPLSARTICQDPFANVLYSP